LNEIQTFILQEEKFLGKNAPSYNALRFAPEEPAPTNQDFQAQR
jgi:hypothetical protein